MATDFPPNRSRRPEVKILWTLENRLLRYPSHSFLFVLRHLFRFSTEQTSFSAEIPHVASQDAEVVPTKARV